ncbi:MAG: alpha-2-macroglobulin family protein [Cyclobacteriaceae bacterium]
MNILITYIRNFFYNLSYWFEQASWRERGIAGGISLLVVVLLVWGLSALFSEDFKGSTEVDEAYNAYISAYTAGVISTQSSFQIKFTRPLADSSMMGKATEESYFSLNPSVKGKSYWLDTQTLEFIPDNTLISGQQYQVKFRLGELMEVPEPLSVFEYALQTIEQNYQLNINGLSYEDRDELSKPVLRGQLITADFAEASAIEKMLQASQDGNALPVEWIHSLGEKSHQFIIRDIVRRSGLANVQLLSQGEPLGIDREASYELEVPSLDQFVLLESRVVEEPEQYVELRFSDPLQENQDLQGLLQLRGAGEELRYVVDNNLLKIYPAEGLSGRRTVVINEGIKNSQGERLRQRTETDVLFEPIKPAVRFVSKGVILPTTDGMMLPFEAVNLKTVDVTVVKIFEENLSQFFQVNQYEGQQEIRRVARPVAQQRVPLNASGVADLGRWNRFTLDLGKIIEADPGAIYQVVLSFRRSQSLYACGEQTFGEADDVTAYDVAEGWDDPSKVYWDAYNQYYYAPDYNWEERDNPCSSSYYGFRRSAQTNLLVSDLGLIAKKGENNELFVVTTNLQTAEPVSADIRVYDFQQQLIAEGSTDDEDGLRLQLQDRTPYLLVASDGDQRTYLRVDDGSSLSLSSFDVAGQEVKEGLKGFIYGDRGVWRPGDSLHINFILEDEARALPANHPVIFQLENARGQLVQRIVKNKSVGGIYNFSTATSADAPTGNWTARVSVGGASFSKQLRIETVRPNRLKIDLDFRTDRFTARNTTPAGQLRVAWLSGATARGLRAEYELLLSRGTSSFEDFSAYTFEDKAREFSSDRRQIFDGQISQEGKAEIEADLSLAQEVPGVLNATFIGKVYEEGGNFSIDRFSLPYYPYEAFVGIKVPEGEGYGGALSTTDNHQVSVVSVNERGQAQDRRQVKMSLYKLDWRWWWEQSEDYIANYVGREYREPVLEETITVSEKNSQWAFRVEDEAWGRYYLRACDTESGHCSGEVIYLDNPAYAGRDRRENPKTAAMLSFSAEKETYQVGEEATLLIPGKGDSQALISIENGSQVLETFWIEMEEEGETSFSFDITEAMTPNVYVHVTLLQPHAQTVNDLPIRMYGIVPLEITDPATHLQPVISLPEQLEPEAEAILTIAEAEGKPMSYTIAMVDEGLLDLTNFQTPAPHDYFYAREALGVKTWDMFDAVIGAYGGKLEHILAIGGDEAASAQGNRRANRFKPMVKFLGPFYLEEGEKNTHTISIPNYVGSVRTMVVAAQDGAYGHTEETTEVSQSLMVLGTLPRVLGPGEELKLPVDIFAMDNSVKSVRVNVSTNELLSLQSKRSEEMFFAAPGDRVVDFDLKVAERIGIGSVEINAASGPVRNDYKVEIDVRNPNPAMTDVISTLLAGGGIWDASFEAIGMTGTQQAILELSDIPPLNLGHRLSYLTSYPHGCIEQTISAAFPQLYLSAVEELNEEEQRRVETNVEEAISRLATFRTNEGAFSYWPGASDADEWSTSYAGHFMLEAQQQGYFIPAGLLQGWISYQKRRAVQWGRGQQYAREDLLQAYRLYTLALAGQAEQGAMNRMREQSGLSLAAKWRLAAAYALLEQREVAESLTSGLGTEVEAYRENYGTYGSDLRDEAMILETLSILGKREEGLRLFRRISSALSNEDIWMSTQTTAYALIAATQFVQDSQLSTGVDAIVSIDGQPPISLQSGLSLMQREIPLGSKEQHTIKVTNQGGGELHARIVLRGQPAPGSESTVLNGLRMSVVYKGKEGEPINIEELTQGTDFVAEVVLYNPGTAGDLRQLALTHIMPSGWEILNTRLLDMEQFNEQSSFDYQDIRDDRVLTYFDLPAGERKTFRVMLNASFAGRFYQPAIYCEAMYDNSINASLGGQWVEVIQP